MSSDLQLETQELVLINSKDRSSSSVSTTDFVVNMGYNRLEGVKKIAFKNCQFVSYEYNVRSGISDTFQIIAQPGNVVITVVLAEGFYSFTEFTTLIKPLLEAELLTAFGGTPVVTFTASSLTSKITLTIDAGGGTLTGFDFDTDANSPANRLIGVSPVGSNALSHEGLYGPRFNGLSRVHIVSSALSDNHTVSSEGRNDQTFINFNVDEVFGQHIHYEPNSPFEVVYNRPIDLNKIDIKVTDERGLVLDLGNYNVSISLLAYF